MPILYNSTGSQQTEVVDSRGNQVEVGVFGALKTSSAKPQVSLVFDKPLLDGRNVTITSGTPSAQYNRTLLRVQNGDSLESLFPLRYLTAQTIETYFTVGFTGTFSSGTDESYIGLFNSTDSGVFLGYKGSDFVVGYRNTTMGADTLQVVSPPPNPENLIRYRIKFGYLGSGDISYEYKVSGKDWQLLHTFGTDGTLTGRTHVGGATLPMRSQCNHVGCEMVSGSWNAQTYGADANLQELPFYTQGQRTVLGNTIPQPVVALRNNLTDGSFPNKSLVELLALDIGSGSEGIYRYELWGNIPLGTIISGAWNPASPLSFVDANPSFTELTTDLGAEAQPLTSITLAVGSQGQGAGSIEKNLKRLGLRLLPGKEFAIYKRQIIAGAGNDETSWAINYAELF